MTAVNSHYSYIENEKSNQSINDLKKKIMFMEVSTVFFLHAIDGIWSKVNMNIIQIYLVKSCYV